MDKVWSKQERKTAFAQHLRRMSLLHESAEDLTQSLADEAALQTELELIEARNLLNRLTSMVKKDELSERRAYEVPGLVSLACESVEWIFRNGGGNEC